MQKLEQRSALYPRNSPKTVVLANIVTIMDSLVVVKWNTLKVEFADIEKCITSIIHAMISIKVCGY